MRDFDLIVYGATGFTGRLVAEYLAATYPGDAAPRWAMAGRSLAKLAAVRDEIGAPADLPLIVADADEATDMAALARRSEAVITTVGPYQLHGGALVAACAAAGTAYLDLCGEVAWMRQMIDAHEEEARRTGARIVFSCGFDSLPFDLGVLTAQEQATSRFGRPAPRVKGRVRVLKGSFSGGTIASAKATMAAAARNPSLIGTLTDPFALTPGFRGPHQPTGLVPEFDLTLNAWVAPFFMAPVNTKNVHRTNFLLGHPYGTDFVYDEMMVAGSGDFGRTAAEAIAKLNPFKGDSGGKTPDGPDRAEREAGRYDLLFAALEPDGGRADAVVTGDRDPGYGSSSKMLVETALCLLGGEKKGGVWTPAALLGTALRDRLQAKAGLTFTAC